MSIFRSIYRKKLLQVVQFLPNERREEVVSQILANTSEWDAFRSSLPRALFSLVHSRRELEEINRKFSESLPHNYENL